MKPIKLEPCPFCGGEAEIQQLGTGRLSTICACTECGARIESPETFNHGSYWNRRHRVEPLPWSPKLSPEGDVVIDRGNGGVTTFLGPETKP